MPYRSSYVDPDLFLEHAGVKVFCVYPDDDIDEGRSVVFYTLNPECGFTERMTSCAKGGPCSHVFNVQRLPTWLDAKCSARAAIIAAIEKGMLTANGPSHLTD